jgi:hypothetical protein
MVSRPKMMKLEKEKEKEEEKEMERIVLIRQQE